jgi:hypothetical protein
MRRMTRKKIGRMYGTPLYVWENGKPGTGNNYSAPASANQDGLAEVKTGESEISSSYQRRLEVYRAVVNDTPL